MLTWKHWLLGIAFALLLSLDGFGCAEGANFRGQTPQAMAECRNIWRTMQNQCLAGGTGAIWCQAQGAEAYDDCMRAKGFREEP